jgi:hypothetical protein
MVFTRALSLRLLSGRYSTPPDDDDDREKLYSNGSASLNQSWAPSVKTSLSSRPRCGCTVNVPGSGGKAVWTRTAK